MKQILLPLFISLVLSLPALAQNAPPVLNTLPEAPTTPETPVPVVPEIPVSTPLPAAAPVAVPQSIDPYQLGAVYRVETMQGTTFTGTVVSISLTAVEFDAHELGHISLNRAQIRQAEMLGKAEIPGKAVTSISRSAYYDIGNGNRHFFAPTARNLRKGEGALQDVDVYLIGVNYGITDNFSLGGYYSLIPGLTPSEQLLVFTPKLNFKARENLHVGAGVLYLRIPYNNGNNAIGAGIVYGVITSGTADNNITLGLGYGFVEGNLGQTPIIQIGGQTRVSRRTSLISENYIVADNQGLAFGLYGVKLNWRHTSLGMGAAYYYTFRYYETVSSPYPNSNGTYNTYSQQQGGTGFTFIPAYFDFTFRFGKGTKQPTR